MFLHAAIVSSKLAFSSCVRVTMALRFFTAVSARPLDSGLCADASSCFIEFELQNSLNSCPNWGLPSVRMVLGQTKELKIVESLPVILAVCMPVSCFSNAYPEYLSTVASHFFPIDDPVLL